MKIPSMLTLYAIVTFLLHPMCFGMDAALIRDLAKKPHRRDGLIDELKVYPDAREYEITVRSGKPFEKLVDAPKVIAAEKIVEGKYVVSECQPPGVKAPLIMVVTFDQNERVYRKWVLLPDDVVGESIGTAVPNTRMLSWVSKVPQKDSSQQILASEVHTDTGTQWREIILDAGKIVGVIEGTARKTK